MSNSIRVHSFGWGVMLFVLLIFAPSSSRAQFDDLFFSGFVSQGYFNSTGNDYLISDSKKGTSEFSEAALVCYANPADRLRIGLQLFARDFGKIGNNNVILDWAYGDYRWRDELGFRAGKIRVPYGLYNQVRDVDIVRDQILLPQSIYDERIRDFITAFEGADLYGSFSLGKKGVLDYEAWAGAFNVPDVTRGFWDGFWNQAGEELAPFLAEQNSTPEVVVNVQFRNVAEPDMVFPWAYGGSLIWETPLEGLRFGSSFFRTELDGTAKLVFDVAVLPEDEEERPEFFRGDILADVDLDVGPMVTVSAEYMLERWTFASEYNYLEFDDGISDGWYGLTSYQLTDKAAVSAYYAAQYPDRSNRDGKNLPLPASAWQRDLSLGLRYDLTPNWRVKYEHHFVDGLAQVDGAEFSTVNPDDFEERWSYFALKTSFHF